ncbi:MAG: ankyrin repeat domain-containing protein [Micavibrio sp.]
MVDQIAQDRLFKAAAKGDKATIRALVFDDIDFDARDEEGRTAFNIATQFRHSDTAQTILAAKQMKTMQNLGLTSAGYENAIRNPARKTGTDQ